MTDTGIKISPIQKTKSQILPSGCLVPEGHSAFPKPPGTYGGSAERPGVTGMLTQMTQAIGRASWIQLPNTLGSGNAVENSNLAYGRRKNKQNNNCRLIRKKENKCIIFFLFDSGSSQNFLPRGYERGQHRGQNG